MLQADHVTETLLTADDVAEILCLKKRIVFRYEAAGQIPKAVRINKKTVRWKASDIQAYLDQLKPGL